MEDIQQDVLQRNFQTILNIIRCTVCLKPARPRVHQCAAGHLVCRECIIKVKECPNCKQPFSSTELPLYISQILEAFPRRCRFTKCEVFLINDDEHEKWCGSRITSCKMCLSWNGPCRDLFSHIQQRHPSQIIFEGRGTGTIGPGVSRFPISAYGQFIWVVTSCKDDFIEIRFIRVPNGKPAEEYCIELSFTAGKSFSKFKFKFDFEGNTGRKIIYIPKSRLPSLCDKDGLLTFKVEISKWKQ